jgi:hypothetical protein
MFVYPALAGRTDRLYVHTMVAVQFSLTLLRAAGCMIEASLIPPSAKPPQMLIASRTLLRIPNSGII